MNQKFIRYVFATVLGISLLITVTTAFSLLFEAITASDVTVFTSVSDSMEKTLSYIRYSAIGILFITAAMLVTFAFTYFSKSKKIFGCISTGLSLFLAVTCIALVFDLRAIVLGNTSSTDYTAATAYFSELITLAVAALLLCSYFSFVTVRAFLSGKPPEITSPKEKTDSEESATEETCNEKD